MARYIDADKAKELIKNYGKGTISDGLTTLDAVDDIVCLAKGVDLIPTADVVEVKHGEWIAEQNPDGTFYCLHCSVCDDDFSKIGIKFYTNYCPKCGAKMDGGK